MKFGYACINLTLSEKGITTNRVVRKKTFDENGLEEISKISILNLQDLKTILEWNVKNNIYLFRLSSSLIPWWTKFELNELPNYDKIRKLLEDIGNYATDEGIRLTFNPNNFIQLASKDTLYVSESVIDLERHSEIFDLMGFSPSVYNKININIGDTYENKANSIRRFITTFKMLTNNLRKRLTIEIDDKQSLYNITDLLIISYEIKTPIVFDVFNYICANKNILNMSLDIATAILTWNNITPIIHISSSKKKYEDINAEETSHANLIYDDEFILSLFKNINVDIMIEAESKELALFTFLCNNNLIEEY
jgi:UV DNA damage endonuclease